jgi:hypothetical protein
MFVVLRYPTEIRLMSGGQLPLTSAINFVSGVFFG